MKYLLSLITISIISACNTDSQVHDHLNLESKLSGKWVATAFDGELHENWKLLDDGFLQQEGFYIERNDTSYAAKTRILKIDEDIILLSVIRDSNPKIFKSSSFEEDGILFENDDYRNPYQVKYEFLSPERYRRTITGIENDSTVIYEFNFIRQSTKKL